MYSGFLVSALVSIFSHHAQLPTGVDKAALALAFVYESLLMGIHKKPQPLVSVVSEKARKSTGIAYVL